MNNFYVIYGIEKGLIENYKKEILKKLINYELIKYDMSINTIQEVIEDATTISMFNKEKVLILEDCFFLTSNKTIEDLDKLEKYISNYNPDCYLIMICNAEKIDSRKKIYKLLSKHKIIEANKVDKSFLIKYIQNSFNEENYKIDDIEFFIGRVGTNLSNINNEIEKLKMYRLDTKTITKEDISKVTSKVLEEEIFALTDAIIFKDTKKSLDLLENFLSLNYDAIQILSLLANQFHFLFQVKRLLNKNKTESEIAKILEVNPYRIKYTVKKLYAYSEEMLLNYIKYLAKIDHDIKLGLINKDLALKLLMIYPNT